MVRDADEQEREAQGDSPRYHIDCLFEFSGSLQVLKEKYFIIKNILEILLKNY